MFACIKQWTAIVPVQTACSNVPLNRAYRNVPVCLNSVHQCACANTMQYSFCTGHHVYSNMVARLWLCADRKPLNGAYISNTVYWLRFTLCFRDFRGWSSGRWSESVRFLMWLLAVVTALEAPRTLVLSGTSLELSQVRGFLNSALPELLLIALMAWAIDCFPEN